MIKIIFLTLCTQYVCTLVKYLSSVFMVQQSYLIFKTPHLILSFLYDLIVHNQPLLAHQNSHVTVPHKHHVYTITYGKIFHYFLHSHLECSDSNHFISILHILQGYVPFFLCISYSDYMVVVH